MAKKIRKDFDKEKMYSKIMPSIVTPPPQPKEEARFGDEPKKAPEGGQRYVLRNFIEDLVMDKMGRTVTMLRGCECERCKKDVMALALNELPSAYTVVDPEELDGVIRDLRQAYDIKVASALIKAVQTVKAHPNHGD